MVVTEKLFAIDKACEQITQRWACGRKDVGGVVYHSRNFCKILKFVYCVFFYKKCNIKNSIISARPLLGPDNVD